MHVRFKWLAYLKLHYKNILFKWLMQQVNAQVYTGYNSEKKVNLSD